MPHAEFVGDTKSAAGGARHAAWLVAGAALWLALNLYSAYRCRFWINSDSIGSIDSARALRDFRWLEGVNGYFGTGFAALLAPLDLSDLTSFLSVHLVNTALLLGAQLALFVALRAIKLSVWLAAVLSTIWAATNYGTGCALYVTADVALCFFAALYLLLVVALLDLEKPPRWYAVVLLGAVHVAAGVTKSIALPTLLVFPAGFALLTLLRRDGRFSFQFTPAGVGRCARFLTYYFVPVVVLGGMWASACYLKYGRLTLGGTAEYNYELFTRESPTLLRAIEEAKQTITEGKSFWWSDPSLSVTGWSHRIEFDVMDQARTIVRNATQVRNLRRFAIRAPVILLLFATTLGIAVGYRRLRLVIPPRIALLAAMGWVAVFLYLCTILHARHLTFPALFSMPLVALAVRRCAESTSAVTRAVLWVMLVGSLLHGAAALVYASEFLAPDDTHFRVAAAIQERSPGAIGVWLAPNRSPRSYGTIALIAGSAAGEMRVEAAAKNQFRATFSPQSVLLIGKSDLEPPPQVAVNGRLFERTLDRGWEGGTNWSAERIAVYLPVSQ